MISEIKRDTGKKNREFFIPLAVDAPLGGTRQSIGMPFDTEN